MPPHVPFFSFPSFLRFSPFFPLFFLSRCRIIGKNNGGEAVRLKRFAALAAAFCLLAALFSACGRDSVKVLYLAVPNTAGSFDPQIAEDTTARIVVRSCFEGLTALDENGRAVPAAAERWTVSDDGLTYTFHLRAGDRWHLTSNAAQALEGKLPEDFAPAVTAADFVFGLQRAADPAMGAPDAALLSNVENARAIMAGEASPDTLGVSAPDGRTVEIRLSAPQADLPETLAEPLCMPCNETFFNATGGRYGLLIKYLLSNGPFYLTRFDETSYRLARNPDYTGPLAPKLEYIWFYVKSDEAARVSALREQALDGAYLTAAGMRSLSPSADSFTLPLRDILRCILVNPGDPLLANDSLRAAFFAAADTNILCDSEGFEGIGCAYPAAVGTPYAPAEAPDADVDALLEAALSALERDSVSFTLICEQAYENSLKNQLQLWQEKLGIRMNLNVEPVSAGELSAALSGGNYQLAFAPITADASDPWDWFVRFTADGQGSVLPLENAAFESAVAALLRANGAAKEASVRRADQALRETHTVVPVWEESNWFYCRSGVTGVIVLPGTDRLYLYAADCPAR